MPRILIAILTLTLGACSFDEPPPGGGPSENNDGWSIEDAGASDELDARSPDDTGGEAPDAIAPAPDLGAPDLGAPDLGPPDLGPPDLGPPDMGRMLTECDGEMVDTESDPGNCGACGRTCDPSFGVCAGGECGCMGVGLEVCRSDQSCVDTQRDPNNCGTCDLKCGEGAACIDGTCQCRPAYTLCDGKCVDTKVDPNHCGGCGMSCGGTACRDWSCRDRCDLLDFRCDQGAGGTACIEQPPRSGSHLHCYSVGQLTCGKTCGGNQLCWDPPGFLTGLDCYDYRPARGCTECPCDDCTGDEECFDDNGIQGAAWCVDT